MTEHPTVQVDTDTDRPVPFEQTDDGHYLVTQPVEGDVPESVTVCYDGVDYTLTDFHGYANQSRFQPDVLVYETCSVAQDTVQTYGVVE